MAENHDSGNPSARHTPGPWQYNSRMQRVEQDPSVFGRDYLPIASPYNANHRADGPVLAAALELLAALKDVLPILEAVKFTVGLRGNQLERMKRAAAAIAKAEGR